MSKAITVLPLLLVGFVRVAAVVSGISHTIHVVRHVLVFSHVHITESSLQGLDADRQNQD